MKGSRHEGGTPTGGRIGGGGKGKLPQNPLSRLDTLGCASVVVVEAKEAPSPTHEVLMSGSLNQPPLASTSLSAIAANRHRRRKPRGVGKTFSVLGG